MAKPNNSIAKVKLPGENVERPIVPHALSKSGSAYQATLPDLDKDSEIALRIDIVDLTQE